jgi:hypothetical protein
MRLRGGGRENQRFAGSNIGITLGNYTPSEGPREEIVGEKNGNSEGTRVRRKLQF